LNKLA